MGRKLYSCVIKNGLIADGSGAPLRSHDVAIEGDRIAAVGEPGAFDGRRIIDARDRVVAPGFIDAHTHDDRILLSSPSMWPKVSQGVTTVVTGNCGIGLAPVTLPAGPVPPPLNLFGGPEQFRFPTMSSYLAAVEDAGPVVNVAPLVGHSALRVTVMADLDRPATGVETARMRALLSEALEAGAIGFSTGLFYPTNSGADVAEVSAMVADVAAAGGVYATHMRDEGDRIDAAIEEALGTAAAAAAPLIISHHKCIGPQNWGGTRRTLTRIAEASRHQDVALDAYPYTAGSTVLLPDLVDERIRILICWSEPHPEMAGRDLAEVASILACSQAEAAKRLSPAGACYFFVAEEDVRRVLASPMTMIGSDGLPHDQHPHPRLWGTFPRILGHYVREVGLFALEVAVHKMTGLPARKFGLRERGAIKSGYYADIVIFDPQAIIDRATYENPHVPSDGVDLVMVNGQVASRRGVQTSSRPGRVLRRAPLLR